MTMMLDDLNSDLLLRVIEYLNVKDGGHVASTCKRFYYLVHNFRVIKGPELVSACSSSLSKKRNIRCNEMMKNAISKLQSEPNLAFAFNNGRSALADTICQFLPKDTVTLGAIASDIESNCDGETGIKSNSSVMLGNLPSATIMPFCLNSRNQYEPFAETFASASVAETNELQQELAQSNVDWKVFIVYACGDRCMVVEDFVSRLQKQYPDATFVGGICVSGFVSSKKPNLTKEDLASRYARQLIFMTRMLGGDHNIQYTNKEELVDYVYDLLQQRKYILQQVDDAVFGVALGGDVPVRSIVSRGVKSVTSSPLVIHEATYVSAADTENGNNNADDDSFSNFQTPYHLIHRIRDVKTGKVFSFLDLFTRLGNLDYVGLKCRDQDGFELHPVYSILGDSLQIPQNRLLSVNDGNQQRTGAQQSSSLLNCSIDLFALDGEACAEHLDAAIQKLHQQTQNEEILGAIMFSCNGREPARGGLVPENMMSDATRFAQVFPNHPCFGFYAGGEIGPIALAGATDKASVFQSGKVCLQGFTVVFALFIVPVVNLSSYNLEDSVENISNFIKSRLSGGI